jgi:hypothetical protein
MKTMSDVGKSLISVIAGVTGLAVIAVLVSRNAQTSEIIKATFGGYNTALNTAVSPVR